MDIPPISIWNKKGSAVLQSGTGSDKNGDINMSERISDNIQKRDEQECSFTWVILKE
jgi:hypothetical protein